MPEKLSSFVQRAGRAARDPKHTGLAVLLVEPAAYNTVISSNNDSIDNVKSKMTKVKAPKEYAKNHGRNRGRLAGDEDILPVAEATPIDRSSADEGLLSVVQAVSCRRRVIALIYDNPEPRKDII